MSEQVGAAEREALERARADVVAQRAGYHRRLQAIAALADLGTAVATGYRSTEALLADRDNLDRADATRLVAEAGDLCARTAVTGELLPARLPATADALAAGAIDPAHVKIIRETMRHLAGLATPPPAQEWCGVERTLAEQARVLPPRLLRRLAQGIVDLYDPDGAAPRDGQDEFDELRLHRRRDGSLVFKGRLGDPMDAEMVIEVFGVLAAPAGAEDERGLVKRNADAFTELVQDARGPRGLATDTRHEHRDDEPAPDADTDIDTDADTDGAATRDGEPCADAGPEVEPGTDVEPEDTHCEGERPLALIPAPRRPDPSTPAGSWTERPGRALLTVTIDHRWLCAALGERGGYGTLDSGHPVDPATVRRWACDAEIVPMILGSTSEPLDVGRRQRTAPDALRRALNLRDGGCAFPGCTRRPRRCHAHHIRHWLDGGDTALHNMCLLCRFHHQLVHRGGWQIAMVDGTPWFTPPWVVDTQRRPRPGGRPRVPL
ncbi:HNH endonuclease signature motif containing protein [Actinomycetospora lemnae]|uniref:DUF222 domain-containing protein n=1 Tax=Actinomycetospora lemnae TaxID=3019891 RepID=A0ABT5ST20_9PSEU|nr:HNH endonuclease signature motif containing protein [Actinomycetospora sp. DW7H6]MDD7965326.1 DUF222 domain-containing protein [Actinomycetospora sp. DW7H6]